AARRRPDARPRARGPRVLGRGAGPCARRLHCAVAEARVARARGGGIGGGSTMTFRAYSESRPEHWVGIVTASEEHERRLADRVLAALHRLSGETLGHPVDRFTHSLQTATRAFRDG